MRYKPILGLTVVLILALLVPVVALAGGTPAGTVIKNVASMTFKDQSGTNFPTVYSDTAFVTVQQLAGLSVTPSGWHKYTGDSANVVYPVTIVNTGNGVDSVTFSTQNQQTGGSWTHLIYNDPSGNGVLTAAMISAGPITKLTGIVEDGTAHIVIVAFVPNGTANGTRDTTGLTVTSQFDPTVKGYQHDTLDVKTAVFTGTKTNSNAAPTPGQAIQYTITFTNGGSSNALSAVLRDTLPSYVTYSSATTSPTVGSFSQASGIVTWTIGSIPAGQAVTLTINTTVNSGVAYQTVISNSANLTFVDSVGNRSKGPLPTPPTTSTVQQSASWQVQVAASAHSFTTNNDADSLEVSKSVFFKIKLTNTGNAADTARLSTPTFTSLSFPWKVFVDVNANGVYDAGDTAWVSGAYTGRINVGSSVQFVAIDTVGQSVSDRSRDSAKYVFTSKTQSSSGYGWTITTVKAPVMSMHKTVTLVNGKSRPGDTLVYTINYTNAGSGTAKGVVVADAVPTNTTYLTNSVSISTDNGATFTNHTDGDGTVTFGGGSIQAVLGDIGGKFVGSANAVGQIKFKVKIN